MDNTNTVSRNSKNSRQLYLNSKYANYTVDVSRNSSCSFVLNEPINVPRDQNCYVSVVSAEIPNTIFSVDQFTNIPVNVTKISGYIGLVSCDGGSTHNITCSPGTSALYPGMAITPQAAFGSCVALTTYYVATIVDGTRFTLSSTYGGGLFAVGSVSLTFINTLYGSFISTTATSADNAGNITVNSLANLSVGTPIYLVGTAFSTLSTSYIYIISSINSTAKTITVQYASSGLSLATTTGSGSITLYAAPTFTQTFNITGANATGTSSNLLLTTGNYSSSIYNTTNPTSLASQFSKALAWTKDGVNDTITLVCYYGIAQTKFYLGFYPTKAYYTISILSPIFGFASGSGLNNPQVFPQLQTAVASSSTITATASTQVYTNLTPANNIPRFFPPYIIVGTNLHSLNQAVGENKVSTLAKVIVDVPYNSFIFYRNFYGYSNWISNREIFTIDLMLYDEYGNLVNMQGSPWSMTLQLDFQ